MGWCSRCDYKWFPDKPDEKAVDPETMRLLEEQAAARQTAEDERRRQKLAEFSDAEIWKEYCERMEASNREWWQAQGVPLDVQQYLSLGYVPDKKYNCNGQYYTSPAYTIPWFGDDFDFLTMQYRLTEPVIPQDKYRFEYGLDGGATHLFRADPGEKIGDKVIVCEGAKKAMVTRYQLLPINTPFVVIAAASKSSFKPIIEAVKNSGLVYVVFDPDGLDYAHELAGKVGKAAHVVSLPYKVDDGFIKYGLTEDQFSSILDTVL